MSSFQQNWRKAEQVLSGSKEDGEEKEGAGSRRGEMTQTMYVHMNI
jgi:hypothetical protein